MKSLEVKDFDDIPNYLARGTKPESKVLTAQKNISPDNILTAITLKDRLGKEPELGEEIALPDGTRFVLSGRSLWKIKHCMPHLNYLCASRASQDLILIRIK